MPVLTSLKVLPLCLLLLKTQAYVHPRSSTYTRDATGGRPLNTLPTLKVTCLFDVWAGRHHTCIERNDKGSDVH